MALKAYNVESTSDDFDGPFMTIIHAETRGKALRLGSRELELDFTEVRARRAPQFDGLHGNDLVRAQLEAGWWFTCGHCDERVDEYSEDEEDDEGNVLIPARRYVIRKGSVYCSARCCIAHLRERQHYRENEWGVVADAIERWPGIEIISRSGLTVTPRGNLVVGSVEFRFPGGLGQAHWVRGDSTVWVERRDVEAWEAFVAHVRAA